MRKILALVPMTLLIASSLVFAEPSTIPEAYVVTLNTTTFTALAIGRKIYAYNPGAYDIKIASASSSVAAARWTVKAATYIPYPIEVNAIMYALATDTNSVSLQLLIAK